MSLFKVTLCSIILAIALADDIFRCGEGWALLNGEKCYQLINEAVTRDEAINACSGVQMTTYLPTINKIESKVEQKQIEIYLFNRMGIRRNVWIGAKRDQNSSQFVWEDGSKLTYENWQKDRPKNDPKLACVQMKPNGKWVDVSCDTKAFVICEKLQIWTFPELQNEFFEWRRTMQDMYEKLNDRIVNKDNRIENLQNALDSIHKKLSNLSSDIHDIRNGFVTHFNKTINGVVSNNKWLNKTIANLEDTIERIVDGMLALRDECNEGCGSNSENDGPSDSQLENIKREILREVESKLQDQMEDVVTDARLTIVSYRRTLQIKKDGKWISLGHV